MPAFGNSVPMACFGPGSLYVTRNDTAGPNTPFNIGYCQEFSYDETAETKELYGQNQYPLVIARGPTKATGKIKAATLSGLALSSCFWGQPFVPGVLRPSLGESHSIPSSSPYTIAVTPPSSGTFDTDLGVTYATSGLPLQKVTSPSSIGQYSLSGSVYTFYSADAGAAVNISYAYAVANTGQQLTLMNTPIGTTPSYQIDYCTSLAGVYYYSRFFGCVSTKLGRTHKLTDFMMPEIDFGFFANSSGRIYQTSQDIAA